MCHTFSTRNIVGLYGLYIYIYYMYIIYIYFFWIINHLLSEYYGIIWIVNVDYKQLSPYGIIWIMNVDDKPPSGIHIQGSIQWMAFPFLLN